jgi:hypothetical protein
MTPHTELAANAGSTFQITGEGNLMNGDDVPILRPYVLTLASGQQYGFRAENEDDAREQANAAEPGNPAAQEKISMDPMDAYARYERAWNDPAAAAALLDEAWADDGVYADDEVPDGLIGRRALVALIAETHETMPGFRVWRTTEPRLLAGRLAVTWSATGGEPPSTQGGTDVIEFDADGRIARVTDVLDTD